MKILLSLFSLLPFMFFGQSVCDSISIDNTFINQTNNQIEVTATNSSGEIFGYPGWIILDDQLDTVAVETINFFGFVGQTTFQLDIQGSLTLPLTGTLNLYSGFYDTLWCSYPITIDSSMLGIQNQSENLLQVYPNPTNGKLYFNCMDFPLEPNAKITIVNSVGQQVYVSGINHQSMVIDLGQFGESGFYFLRVVDEYNQTIFKEKVILH